MKYSLLLFSALLSGSAASQDLLLDVTDPMHPQLQWPTGTHNQFVIEAGTPHGITSIQVKHTGTGQQLRFGGANEPLFDGKKQWSISLPNVIIGAGGTSQKLDISDPKKLRVVVKSAGGIGEWEYVDPSPILSSFNSTNRAAGSRAFIPSEVVVKEWVQMDSRLGDPTNPERRIVVDAGSHKWIYQELAGSGAAATYKNVAKKKNFMPRVGSELQFRVINYDPTRNSVDITTDFSDLHLELQSRFGALWDPGSVTDSDIAATHSGEEEDARAAATTADAQAALFDDLRADLKTLFEELQKLDNEDAVNDRSGLYRIKEYVALRITEKLGFDPDATNAFTTRAGEIVTNSAMTKTQSQAFMGVASAAAKYYSLIEKIGSYNRLPVSIENRDVLDVSITFRSASDNSKVESTSFRLWNHGGFKIDFSAGFMWTSLVDHEFASTFNRTEVLRDTAITGGDTTITITNKEKYTIHQNNGSDFSIGAGLLAHAYYRTGRSFNPALSVGFMLNNDAVAKYLLGLSLAIGRESRFVLTGGVAYGKVNRLKTGLEVGGDLEPGTTDVPTEQVWQNNWFVGVGLNFAKAKAAAAPSTTP